MSGPHDYIKANLGHSPVMCRYCGGTPAENAALGEYECAKAQSREAATTPPQISADTSVPLK